MTKLANENKNWLMKPNRRGKDKKKKNLTRAALLWYFSYKNIIIYNDCLPIINETNLLTEKKSQKLS